MAAAHRSLSQKIINEKNTEFLKKKFLLTKQLQWNKVMFKMSWKI